MFWKRDHKVIKVEMIDVQTRTVFSRVQLPIDRLPKSFEAETTMHVKERDYTVVKAIPMTAAEFRRTGKLTLVLRETNAQSVDPQEILFSLPTIYEAVAPIVPGSMKLDKNVLELHEDDWRQREFISRSHQDEIDKHFSEIRRIYDKQRVESGFKKIHVRKGLSAPLEPAAPPITDLAKITGATMLDGVAYDGIAGMVDAGVAITLLNGIELYGIMKANRFTILCIGNTRVNNAPLEQAIAPLAALAEQHELCLVDWCRAEQVQPDELLAYFQRIQ